MRIVHEENEFFAVYSAPQAVCSYLRRSVPAAYRRYESEPSSRWLVHRKYLEHLGSLAGVGTTLKVDPYATLFLTKDAPTFMIDAAWKALALHHHPDRGGSSADFQKVKDAYEELKNERDNDGGPA